MVFTLEHFLCGLTIALGWHIHGKIWQRTALNLSNGLLRTELSIQLQVCQQICSGAFVIGLLIEKRCWSSG
jgi:hypothetical protein